LARVARVRNGAGGTAGDAIAAARRAVKADPKNSGSRTVLAEVALAVGAGEIALEAAGDAIRMNPRASLYDDYAARAARSMSDQQAARSLLEGILETKDSAVLRAALARVYVDLGNLDLARQNARRALTLDPNNAEARSILGGG